MSKADQLLELKKLLDDGTLTQEEFDAQKARFLSEGAPATQEVGPVKKRKSAALIVMVISSLIVILGGGAGFAQYQYTDYKNIVNQVESSLSERSNRSSKIWRTHYCHISGSKCCGQLKKERRELNEIKKSFENTAIIPWWKGSEEYPIDVTLLDLTPGQLWELVGGDVVSNVERLSWESRNNSDVSIEVALDSCARRR